MVMQTLIPYFLKHVQAVQGTRGHNFTLVKEQSRLDVRNLSFQQMLQSIGNVSDTGFVGQCKGNETVAVSIIEMLRFHII